ncbi:unnamed protein product [Effrenium voratum]|nr:unnamed protein product [Effrenium voratum]
MAVSASCAWQAAPARLARLQRRCFSDEEKAVLCHSNAGDEGYFKRNFQRGRRTRVEMMQQISSAHDQMRVFYELGRQNLMAKGRLTPDEAEGTPPAGVSASGTAEQHGVIRHLPSVCKSSRGPEP